MKLLTQTRDDNCWQTCVAMLLGCDPSVLPAQQNSDQTCRASYATSLRCHLHRHHKVTYVEIGEERFAEMTGQRAAHLMIGETVRTSLEHDVWHAIVGIGGSPHWDVHPSRAGLTQVVKFGILVPVSTEWITQWQRNEGANCRCDSCAAAVAA